MRPILLVRPDHNRSDAEALAAAGIDSVICPLLQVVPVPDPDLARELAKHLAALNLSRGRIGLAPTDPPSGHELPSHTSGEAGPSPKTVARPVERVTNETFSATWLVVTSPRTWKMWQRTINELDSLLAEGLAHGLQLATVGARTASSLPDFARERIVTPPGISAEHLLAFLLEHVEGTSRPTVLLPHSARARRLLPDGLRQAGWHVLEAAIYDTVPIPGVRLPDLTRLGGVLLRSPSAASALASLVPSLPSELTVFAVGPITAARCRELGWRPVEIDSTNPDAIATAVAQRGGSDRGMLES